MSTTSTARPPPATASSTRCVSCSPATPKRSTCSPIRWAIGSRSRRSGRSRFRATCHSEQDRQRLSRGARYRHRRVQIADAPLRQAAKAFLHHPLPGRSRAVSVQNHRGRRHAGRRQPRCRRARRAGRDRHRSVDLKATDSTNHDKFAQLAAVAPELRGVLARGIAERSPSERRGQTAVSGVGAIVSLPLTILGAPIKIIAGQ